MTSTPRLRRADKEMTSREEIDAVLQAAEVCRLALAVAGEPYLVPLSFGYDGRRLFFHTALEGRKLEMLAANPRACFEVETGVRLLRHPERACSWSFAFASVIGHGTVRELLEPGERRAALEAIMAHYGGEGAWNFPDATLARTRVWALEIESVTGKRSSDKGE